MKASTGHAGSQMGPKASGEHPSFTHVALQKHVHFSRAPPVRAAAWALRIGRMARKAG